MYISCMLIITTASSHPCLGLLASQIRSSNINITQSLGFPETGSNQCQLILTHALSFLSLISHYKGMPSRASKYSSWTNTRLSTSNSKSEATEENSDQTDKEKDDQMEQSPFWPCQEGYDWWQTKGPVRYLYPQRQHIQVLMLCLFQYYLHSWGVSDNSIHQSISNMAGKAEYCTINK